MRKKLPYSVPEGYFESLSARLSAIPAKEAPRTRSFRHVAGALAIAASLAAGVLIGTNISRQKDAASTFQDDIIAYLIDSGTTLDQIGYSLDL
jgi:hypothetical protein